MISVEAFSTASAVIYSPYFAIEASMIQEDNYMNIPNDPIILLSFINTKLRDEFSDLDELCGSMCISRDEIERKLESVGYKYDKETNSFR